MTALPENGRAAAHVDDATIRRMEQALDRAAAALESEDARKHEPIEIVGVGCRLPGGVRSPEEFRRFLREGRDGIVEVPAGRWDGSMDLAVRRGGFLSDVDCFDAAFFGITPREALSMDPQQRLLLETAWEALEQASIPPSSLRGQPVGVFIGVTANDYARVLEDALPPEEIDAYFTTGNALNSCAGRLSFTFGLEGPSMAVDTACSSSLTAIHLACQALRNRECDLALAGGVNLALSPEIQSAICRAGMLAADGRSKAFAADADGYGRGEGCAVLVLERAGDAARNSRRAFARIRGTAVRQDGASSGLTVPNGPAQRETMRRALAAARVAPHEVGYLEAHGTGTPLGDPIEIGAAAAVYGEGRKEPLVVGSVKSAIGHLEAAAGVAGVIKAALALDEGVVPAQLGFSAPNPHVDWSSSPLVVPREETPLAARLAAVSSFGASGTNAHAVLEAGPQVRGERGTETESTLLLSAKTNRALADLVARYRDRFRGLSADDVVDVCWTAAVGRDHFEKRAAFAGGLDALRRGLEQWTPDAVPEGDLARRYVSGERLEWAAELTPGRLVDLPTYPFEPARHWPPRKRVTRGAQNPVTALIEAGDVDCLAARLGEDAREVLERLVGQVRAAGAGANHLLWRSTWREKPVWSPVGGLAAQPAGAVRGLPVAVAGLDDYLAALDRLEEIAVEWILLAFGDLAPHGEPLDAETLGVAPERRRFFAHLQAILEQANALGREPGDADRQLARLASEHPEAGIEIALLARCGPRLADVLRGACDPLALLFPSDGSVSAADLYRDAAGARAMNRVLGEAVRGLFAEAPTGRRMRVLEVGAGTGGSTAAVLGALPAGRVDYLFTDVSAAFLGEARQRFGSSPGVRFQAFDIERDPLTQDLEAGGFDLIVAANVLHATRSIDESLSHLRRLLAPGGALALLEGVRPLHFVDLLFGMTDGWWRFEDTQTRASHPLLSVDDWLAAFARNGFASSGAPAAQGLLARQSVLVARTDGELAPARRLTLEGFSGDEPLGDVEEVIYRPRVSDCPRATLEQAVGDLLRLIRALDAQRRLDPPRLTIVTQGELFTAPFAGLAKSLALEWPSLRCRLVEVDGPDMPAAELAADDGESEIRLCDGRRGVARLTPASPDARAPEVRADASYLITGGLGGLGLRTAEWLADRGARHLVLLGRSAAGDAARRRIEALEERGARVRTFAADVSDLEAMTHVIKTIQEGPAPLRGVIHSAGALADGLLLEQTWTTFETVFRAKVFGAWNLDRLTRRASLDFFILYSSAVSLWGAPGQGNHAAANSFLDALARRRAEEGLCGLSIAWGPWAEIGAAANEQAERRAVRSGLRMLQPDEGFRALDELFGCDGAVGVVAADWRAVSESSGGAAFFAELAPRVDVAAKSPAADASAIVARLGEATDAAQKRALIADYLAVAVEQILSLDAPPARERSLAEIGFDSLVGAELKNRIAADLRLNAPMALLIGGATIDELADRLHEQLLLAGVSATEMAEEEAEELTL